MTDSSKMEVDPGDQLWTEGSDLEDQGFLDAAVEKYRQAVELGNVNAMNNLANLYDDKLHTKRPHEARLLYIRAAGLGSYVAAGNLAVHYERLGDTASKLYWRRRAIELGDEDE